MRRDARAFPFGKIYLGCVTVPALLVALAALGFGAYQVYQGQRLLNRGQTAQGRVTELKEIITSHSGSGRAGRGSSGGRSLTYAPAVEFSAADGRPFRFVSSASRNPPAYTVGEAVEVVYDPADPSQASMRAELGLGGIRVLALVAVAFMAVGLLPPLVVWIVKKRRAS